MTLPEVLLWRALRERPDGFRFRRQHPLGPYVLDFYCPATRLAIEVDGIAQDMGDNPERDAWLREQGVTILRIPAREVLKDLAAVVTLIADRCAPPLHQPPAGPPPMLRMGRIEDRCACQAVWYTDE